MLLVHALLITLDWRYQYLHMKCKLCACVYFYVSSDRSRTETLELAQIFIMLYQGKVARSWKPINALNFFTFFCYTSDGWNVIKKRETSISFQPLLNDLPVLMKGSYMLETYEWNNKDTSNTPFVSTLKPSFALKLSGILSTDTIWKLWNKVCEMQSKARQTWFIGRYSPLS